jgi:hypothetical protein
MGTFDRASATRRVLGNRRIPVRTYHVLYKHWVNCRTEIREKGTMIEQVNVGVMIGGLFSVWLLFFLVQWFGVWVMRTGW